MYRKLASVVLVAAAINAKYAGAIGLGEMTMHSALNQPLDAEIKLSNAGDLDETQVLIALASDKEFVDAGIERTFFLSNIKFKVILDDAGNGIIQLVSRKRLNEPFLDFLLEVKWPTGRMLHSYTALVDLPVYNEVTDTQVNLGNAGIPAKAKAVQEAFANVQPKTSEPATQPQSTQIESASVATVDVAEEKQVPQENSQQAVATPQTSQSRAGVKNIAVADTYDDDTYHVQRSDTLWSIARQVKPASDISVQQTIVAIQQLNPHAFVGNNINRLKAGEVLRLPSDEAVREISARSAIKNVSNQNRQWQQAQLEGSDARPTSYKQASDTKGYLSLTSSGAGTANGSSEDGAVNGGLQAQLTSAQEDVEVAKLENAEKQERIQSLDSQVDKLERIIELQSTELANLQQQLGKTPEEIAAADKQVAVLEEQSKELEKLVEEKAELVVEEKATEEKPAEETMAEEEQKTVPAPVKQPQAAEPGLLDKVLENPIYIGGVALVIVLLVVGLLLRRRSQAEQQALEDAVNFDFTEDDQQEDSIDNVEAVEEFEEEVDEFELEESQDEVEEEEEAEELSATTQQTGDAIGEADIYIAYGRYEQAVELLQGAIAVAPQDGGLRTKLLEVYLESQNKEGFQEQFVELQSLGDTDSIANAKELLTSAEGAADWLDNLPTAGSGVQSIDSQEEELLDVDVDSEFDVDLGLDLGSEDDVSDDLSLDLDDLSVDSEESASEEVGEQVEESLEDSFDLDLDSLDAEVDELASEESSEDDSLDEAFDLDTDSLDAEADELMSEADELTSEEGLDLDDAFDLNLDTDQAAEELDESVSLDLDDDLSLDLSSIDDTALEESEELEVEGLPEAEASDESLDFDLDLSQSEIDTVADTEEGLGEEFSLGETNVDLAALDIGDQNETQVREAVTEEAVEEVAEESIEEESTDIESSELEESVDEVPVESELEPAAETEEELSPLATLEGEDLEFLTDADEVSTKLDLAQAYIDMGDVDGARDILMEVMKEGKDEQKAEATSLLDGLD